MNERPTIRLRLADRTSEYIRDQLRQAGAQAGVAVIGEGSWPDSNGAIVLFILPCSLPTADAAAAVAAGTATARRRPTDKSK